MGLFAAIEKKKSFWKYKAHKNWTAEKTTRKHNASGHGYHCCCTTKEKEEASEKGKMGNGTKSRLV